MTIHGITHIFYGHPLERLVWFTCVALVLAFSLFMSYGYAMRYFAFDIRTEIRLEEKTKIKLPAITFCLESTFDMNVYCHGNQSIGRKTCNRFRKRVTEFWNLSNPSTNLWEPVDSAGQDCYIYNGNGSIELSGKKEYVTIRINTWTQTVNDGLIIDFTDPEELKARKEMVYLSEINTKKRLGPGSYDLYLKKTKTTRLPSPYPTNCTDEANANVFSSKYTKASCQESCAVHRMNKHCGDVIDKFKNYANKSSNASLDPKYSSVRECLEDMVRETQTQSPSDCTCNLQCHETTYRTSVKKWSDNQNFWIFYIYYEDSQVETVSQVQAYSLGDFLGALGGILGLCIGMSILSGVQIIIFCIVFVMSRFS